jgi:hypothetical protein
MGVFSILETIPARVDSVQQPCHHTKHSGRFAYPKRSRWYRLKSWSSYGSITPAGVALRLLAHCWLRGLRDAAQTKISAPCYSGFEFANAIASLACEPSNIESASFGGKQTATSARVKAVLL